MAVTLASDLELAAWVHDARQRTFDLIADLSDEQLFGPQLAIINPLLWEIGHVSWFQEKWVLRTAAAQPPIRRNADALYDSAAVHHDTRWDLPLPSRDETLAYIRAVRDRVADRLERGEADDRERYFVRLSVFHEDMHTEAFTYTRQTLGYPAPRFTRAPEAAPAAPLDSDADPIAGDAEIPGGTFLLGALRPFDRSTGSGQATHEPFVFDNEKWAHPVDVRPFAIARAAVTQAEFAAFVDGGGYANRAWWSEAGWRWRAQAQAEHPMHWRRHAGWMRRDFDRWLPLEPHRPVIHVNWFEADAYCRWAGRRLPTEAEWEVAAAGYDKRRFPWGAGRPRPQHANLAWQHMGCVDVGALPAGDSAFGCRQMIGNVWEWTNSVFGPYPGFEVDPYKEYSEPWFHTHMVLRGGAWPTQPRLLRNTWRNFYQPHRRDVWGGFRTCRR
jgi:iron(II)-dependent oxidoreductase